jgi:hypothetical protein
MCWHFVWDKLVPEKVTHTSAWMKCWNFTLEYQYITYQLRPPNALNRIRGVHRLSLFRYELFVRTYCRVEICKYLLGYSQLYREWDMGYAQVGHDIWGLVASRNEGTAKDANIGKGAVTSHEQAETFQSLNTTVRQRPSGRHIVFLGLSLRLPQYRKWIGISNHLSLKCT